jgi:hypothetical protein
MADEITPAGTSYVPPVLPLEPKPKPKTGKGKKPVQPPKTPPPPTLEPAVVLPSDLDDDDDDLPGVGRLPTFPSAPVFPGATGVGRLPPMMPSQAQMRQQAGAQQQQINDDFESHLSSLEFEGGHHSVTVHRLEPEFDPITGKRIVGYLEKYTRAVTFEEIRSKYGGGKYRFLVHGPGAFGKGAVIKANKVYEIAGDPIPQRSPGPQQPIQTNGLPTGVSDIIDKTLNNQEKQTDRLAEENRELKTMLMANMNKGDSGFKETVMAMMAEERRMQEIRAQSEKEEARAMRELLFNTMNKNEQAPNQVQNALMEERRLQEQRIIAEREERRREQDIAERRHQQTLEAMRMQNEKAIEQMKVEQERVRAEAREASERTRQQFELQLRQIEKQESQKETQSHKMTEFMSSLQNQQMQQMQAAQQMQLQQMQQFTSLERDFMLKQIDALSKKKEDTGIDQLLKFKTVFDTLTGKDEPGDQKETWEKVLDRINDSVPGIVAAAGLLRPGSSGPSPQPQQRVLPGSVAVVEVEAEDEAPRQRKPLRRRRRPEPQTVDVVAAPSASVPVVQGEVPNDYTEFVFPQQDTSMEATLEMLVKDIDLALQRDASAEEIRETVVSKFPPQVAALLAETDVNTVIGVLEARAPATWRINSLDGQKKVREMHALLASNG